MPKGKRNKSFSFLNNTSLKNFQRRFSILKRPEIYLFLGLILIGFGVFNKINDSRSLAFDGPIPKVSTVSNIHKNLTPPNRILIPTAEIDLPVEQTVIHGDNWQISGIGVSHLATSAYPGTVGNIILYGHNTKERLGNLKKVKEGDIIYISSENDTNYTYSVVSVQTVEPTEIDVLFDYEGQIISIYTCTGFADLKRLVVKAKRLNPNLTDYK